MDDCLRVVKEGRASALAAKNLIFMIKITDQINFWQGDFGNGYVDRNPQSIAELNGLYHKDYGVTRKKMNEEFLADMDRNVKILEVGANIGLQLEGLRRMGFSNLLGVEINAHAVLQAKRLHPDVDVIRGSGFELPFRDGYFDLVFTSGVLIHVAPKDLPEMLKEVVRVSRSLIWGFEYYGSEPEEIVYRGRTGFLWKRDFSDFYHQSFSELMLVKERKYPMNGSENVSQMFLFKKT